MEQELIDYFIANGVREVLSQEPVYAGNRPLTVKYTLDNQVMIETITYGNSAISTGWAAEITRQYALQEEQGFTSIEI